MYYILYIIYVLYIYIYIYISGQNFMEQKSFSTGVTFFYDKLLLENC